MTYEFQVPTQNFVLNYVHNMNDSKEIEKFNKNE